MMPVRNISPRVVTGPEAVKAAAAIAAVEDRRDQWPYPWSFPPPNAKRVFRVGSLLAPAAPVFPALTVTTEVLAYQVPQGYRFWLCSIVQVYIGAGFVAGSGDILWTLDKNRPIGVAPLQGEVVQGFAAVGLPLGSLAYPWPLDMPELLGPTDILRSKVTTTNAIPQGNSNFFHSIFSGWLEPETKGR